jgi:hypothetical protein
MGKKDREAKEAKTEEDRWRCLGFRDEIRQNKEAKPRVKYTNVDL